MEAVRENPVLCGTLSLVLVRTIWMRCTSHCLSGAKLRLKIAVWNGAAIDNDCHSRQHASTDFENHCFSEKALLLCSVIQMNRCSLIYLNYCLLDYVWAHLNCLKNIHRHPHRTTGTINQKNKCWNVLLNTCVDNNTFNHKNGKVDV